LIATPAKFPDLVVREVVVRPAEPKVGDTLSFEALVENIGNEATEAGVTLGIKFSVAGKTVAWCDSVKQSLAPGEKVRGVASSGPEGRGTWVATPGTYPVTAIADDVNRIVESHPKNMHPKNIAFSFKVGVVSESDRREMFCMRAEKRPEQGREDGSGALQELPWAYSAPADEG